MLVQKMVDFLEKKQILELQTNNVRNINIHLYDLIK